MPPSPEPSVHANDIFVDGFIARTFSPAQDARDYFASLFRTPYFLQPYEISYSCGTWSITKDPYGHFTRQQLSRTRSPIQDLPQPVDFDARKTQGTVIPQRLRAQARYENSYIPQLPIFFVHQNGGVGFSLSDILQGHDSGLYNCDEEAPLEESSIKIRISWPTYADWGRSIQLVDESYARNRLTRARFMKAVGRSVEKFFITPPANHVVQDVVDPRWRIGVHGITQNDVKIIGVMHMSYKTWMPIIQLISQVL